jgi:hypothetical protein
MNDPKQPRDPGGPSDLTQCEINNESVLQWWAEIRGAPERGSPAERAERLLQTMRADSDKRVLTDYERRACALDLVHACWPQGHYPSAALTAILKTVLRLSDDHQVGGWMVYFKDEYGHVQDSRGSRRNFCHWLAAAEIESKHITKQSELKEAELGRPMTRKEFREHVKPMSDRLLEKEMKRRFGSEAPSRSTLREWRRNADFAENREYRAYAYDEGVEPPEGAWLRPDGDDAEARVSERPDEGAAKK